MAPYSGRRWVGQGARVVVGQDNRPHSPGLAQGLMEGLMAAGVDVRQPWNGSDASRSLGREPPGYRRCHPDHRFP